MLPTSLTQMFEGQDHRFKKRRNYDMKNKQKNKQNRQFLKKKTMFVFEYRSEWICYLFYKKRILQKIFLDIKKRLVLNKTRHFLKSGHWCVVASQRRFMLAPAYRSITQRKFIPLTTRPNTVCLLSSSNRGRYSV